MKSRDVVGARIVGIGQQRIYNSALGKPDITLVSITLDNGRTIVIDTRENDYYSYPIATVIVR